MTGEIRILVAAFAASFLATGLPYWPIPYAQVELPGDIWGWGLVVVSVVAFACRAFLGTRAWLTALVAGSAVPAAVFARVVVEGIQDPTSHNLWPLELILSAGPGLLAAGVGALAGALLARIGGQGGVQ